MQVSEFMTRDVKLVSPDDTIQQAAKAMFEKELHALRSKPAGAPAGGGGASSEEVEKLKTDLGRLKQRAAAAETAMEAAASLKAKVARLEAQLKAGPAKK